MNKNKQRSILCGASPVDYEVFLQGRLIPWCLEDFLSYEAH
jgi:hypothetical protein